jgi:hypothetical protein
MFSLSVACLPIVAERAGIAPASGLVAAAIMVALPLNFYSETSGTWEHAESSFALLVLLTWFITLHNRRWSDRRLIAALGVLVGLIAMLSPVLLGAGALMMLAEILTQKGHQARVLRGCGAILIIAAVTICPWALRNYRALGAPVLTRSNFGLELFVGNHDEATGVLGGRKDHLAPFVHEHHPFTSAAEQTRYRQVGELRYMREKQDKAVEWIREHPLRFTSLTLKRVLLFLFTGPEMWPADTRARTLKFLVFCGLGVGAVLGLSLLFSVNHPVRWLFLASLTGPAFPYAVTSVDFRYRYPIYPITVLLTAVALHAVLGNVVFGKTRRRPCASSTSSGRPAAPRSSPAATPATIS